MQWDKIAAARLLLTNQVLKVFFVFADCFDQIHVWKKIPARQSDCPRLAIRLQVVNGDSDIDVSEVDAPETFGDVRRFGLRMSVHIQPPFIIYPAGFDDQRIAVPLTDGVSKVSRLPRFGERTPIQ